MITGTAADLLRAMAELRDEDIDLGEAALALAALDRPAGEMDIYRAHLRTLADDARQSAGAAAPNADRRRKALNSSILDKHGYCGDSQTYDDIQNANLMRVIDRRRGLPVALGILYIATARALGWEACGLNFPGHFLIRLDAAGERMIVDPFHEGRRCDAAELRDLLKLGAGLEAELEPQHYEAMPQRDVLIRLQNNIKTRLVHRKDFAGAERVVESMLLFAPNNPPILRDLGVLRARQGRLVDAIDALEHYASVVDEADARQEAARLIQRLRGQLN